jgi:hypothetical protein
MGTYRTKPEEVEAIQYTGNPTEPFAERTPGWVWAAFSGAVLTFSAYGMTISYNGLSEHVSPNDWLVMSSDNVIRACEDKVFRQYYTSYRNRRTKAEIDAERAADAAAVQTTVTAPAAAVTTATDADVEEMEKALAAAFPEVFETKNVAAA